MFRYFPLVVKNCLRNRRRSLLTVTSIAVSLCLLGILMAMYRALFAETQTIPAQALRLVTHHKVSITQPMPVSYASKIKLLPGVRNVMIWQWIGGTFKDARDPHNVFPRFAVEPEKFFGIMGEIELPEAQKLEFIRMQTSCIVGKKLAVKFDWKPGERITIMGDVFPVDLVLTLVGVYHDPEETENLYFNYKYLRELLIGSSQGPRADEVGVFLVQANSPGEVSTVAETIDKEFENSTAATKSESERSWQLSFISFLGDLKLFLLSISGALAFTILLVTSNTISMSVRERFREIGVLKVLGFRRGAVLGIIFGESALMAVAGGLAGIIIAEGLCILLRGSVTAFATLKLGMTFEVAAGVLFASVLIGLMSSFIPAWSGSRISILDSFRNIE
jgi:putative ABC transport system permease protein